MAKKNDNNDKLLGMLSHLLMFAGGFIIPLVFYLVFKEEKAKKFVAENARHALNFSISIFIYWLGITIITTILTIVTLGFFGLLASIAFVIFGMFVIVMIISASVKSYKGEIYKYPLEIEFIK